MLHRWQELLTQTKTTEVGHAAQLGITAFTYIFALSLDDLKHNSIARHMTHSTHIQQSAWYPLSQKQLKVALLSRRSAQSERLRPA